MLTCEQAQARYPAAITFTFGDSASLNALILDLVRTGRKTVTCDAWDAYAARAEPLPEPGRVDIALDWGGMPQLALRTVAIERIKFCDMDAGRIPPQGEFRDLADWKAGYEAYLRRAGLFQDDVLMLVETFEVVEDFS
ncbi:MAG: ASCH domain-containing protein [Roseobacter sp.]